MIKKKKKTVLYSSAHFANPHSWVWLCFPLHASILKWVFSSLAGQFQQHCHYWHFSWFCRTGELRRGACHLPDSPQHLRRAAALDVSPRLLPELRERQVSVSRSGSLLQLAGTCEQLQVIRFTLQNLANRWNNIKPVNCLQPQVTGRLNEKWSEC